MLQHRGQVPIIVAESLVELADPLAAELDPGEFRTVREVVDNIRNALAPIEATVDPPPWLRPEQCAPFRRIVAALERHGTALLADPAGSGKSYIALAVAKLVSPHQPVTVLVPAVIRSQWEATAARLGVSIEVTSHEITSRGRLPRGRPSLVIVDESHRFRNPQIRRYRELARWLRGSRLLLLTATPVVNRLEDLGHQLLLGLRSDALALDGVSDIQEILALGQSHAAFGNVVLCRSAPADQPRARHRTLPWTAPEEFTQWIEAIDQLQLSTSPGVAALIRVTLLRSLSSSAAALAGGLRRYLALLEHARAAESGGRLVTRDDIRRFSSAGLDQLVLWDLLPQTGETADLVLADIEEVRQLLAMVAATDDPRISAILDLLRDGRPTIVFTASRDTLSALRARAGSLATTVLDWFRPGHEQRSEIHIPHILLTTDVAAEGLDLQRAERIVHFDLPWTPMRVDQREGRAVRLGSRHAEVEVLRWNNWPALEERLRQSARLLDKRRIIRSAGLDATSHWLFRWRSEFGVGESLAGDQGPLSANRRVPEGPRLPSDAPVPQGPRLSAERGPGPPAHTAVAGDEPGWLVAIAFDRMTDGRTQRVPAELLWLPDGEVTVDPALATELLREAVSAPVSSVTDTVDLRLRLADWVRTRLRAGDSSRWLASETSGKQRRLIRRLQRLARIAAAARDGTRLDLLQRTVDALSGGLTAGEQLRVDELLTLDDARLLSQLNSHPVAPRQTAIAIPRLRGLIRINFPA